MKKEKIIIIGAGVSGLTAGIFGQFNGFETEIHEMNTLPGGECTGWDRNNYHFDGCIHYMMGTKPGTYLNKLWAKTGALGNDIEIVNTPYLLQYEENGKLLKLYRDVNLLEAHLLEISPVDHLLIRGMCKAIRSFHKMEIPEKPMELFSIGDKLKMLFKMIPLMPYLKKYNSISIKDFALQFKHPLIQQAILNTIPEKYSAFALLSVLSGMNAGDNGWPQGGSRAMAIRMEKKYQLLGGKVHYRSKVEKIKVVDKKATGIICSDGSEYSGDIVISAIDGYHNLKKLLDDKYTPKIYDIVFNDKESYPLYNTLQVSLGIACDLSKHPDVHVLKLSEPFHAGGMKHQYIKLKHYCYDPSIAPAGKSVITIQLNTSFDWWKEIYPDKGLYKSEKENLSAQVCRAIEEIYPEITGKIETIDIATPMTYYRYCNAYQGAYQSWMQNPKSKIYFLPIKFPQLNGFYMAGQWTTITGGLPMALMSGKWAIQRICKDMKIPYKIKI